MRARPSVSRTLEEALGAMAGFEQVGALVEDRAKVEIEATAVLE